MKCTCVIAVALVLCVYAPRQILAQGNAVPPSPSTIGQAQPDRSSNEPGILRGSELTAVNNRVYGSAEYLLWWMKGTPTPPLLTTSTSSNTMFLGAVGTSGTQVLVGGSHFGTAQHSGGQLGAGYWFDDNHAIGVELNGFALDLGGEHYFASSGGSYVLARPFADTAGNANALIVAGTQSSTGVLDSGAIEIRYRGNMWGADANVRSNVWNGGFLDVDLVAGLRTLGLDESLEIEQQSSPTSTTNAGTVRDVYDMFKTANRFYGGQVGMLAKFTMGRWFLGLSAKVAIGGTQSYVTIDGRMDASVLSNSVLDTTQSGVSAGGLLASPTNIGNYTNNRFSFVPEAGVKFGYQITPRWRVIAGYNFLYWSNVGRPGSQIDTVLSGRGLIRPNPTSVSNRPRYLFTESDIWAQGVNLGLDFRF